MFLLFLPFYSLSIKLSISYPPNYLQIICDFPKWWSLLTYDGFNYHVNFTDDLGFFSEGRTKVDKEEAGTSYFNHTYDKLQENQEKAQTRHLLDLALPKVHIRINQ